MERGVGVLEEVIIVTFLCVDVQEGAHGLASEDLGVGTGGTEKDGLGFLDFTGVYAPVASKFIEASHGLGTRLAEFLGDATFMANSEG